MICLANHARGRCVDSVLSVVKVLYLRNISL